MVAAVFAFHSSPARSATPSRPSASGSRPNRPLPSLPRTSPSAGSNTSAAWPNRSTRSASPRRAFSSSKRPRTPTIGPPGSGRASKPVPKHRPTPPSASLPRSTGARVLCLKLGNVAAAQQVLAIARQHSDALLADHPGVTEYVRERAKAYVLAGVALSFSAPGNAEQATLLFDEALVQLEKIAADQPASTEALADLVDACALIASSYSNAGLEGRAKTTSDHVRSVARRLVREHPDVPVFAENYALIESLFAMRIRGVETTFTPLSCSMKRLKAWAVRASHACSPHAACPWLPTWLPATPRSRLRGAQSSSNATRPAPSICSVKPERPGSSSSLFSSQGSKPLMTTSRRSATAPTSRHS